MVEIKKLQKEYMRNGQSFHAVNGVDLKIKKGELVAVIGHSGCGKSTLLNMITGMLLPTSGQILIDGEDITKKNHNELASIRNTLIGYVMQGQSLLSNFNITDNICMPAYLSKDKKYIGDRAKNLLKKVGLQEMSKSYPSSLSGGEMRRVAIARAMINDPSIIVADEPTSDLDPDNSKKIMDFFRSIANEGTTVIVSTHDMDFIDYADKVYAMEKGVICNKVY